MLFQPTTTWLPGIPLTDCLCAQDGVNEFIQKATAAGGKGNMLNGGPLPMLFMLLGIDPEPWQPEDTLGILRVLCYQMNHGDRKTTTHLPQLLISGTFC